LHEYVEIAHAVFNSAITIAAVVAVPMNQLASEVVAVGLRASCTANEYGVVSLVTCDHSVLDELWVCSI
jgi:hypothetical protein